MREIKFQLVLGDKIIEIDRIEWRKDKPYRAGYFDKDADKTHWFYVGTSLGYQLREYTGLKDKDGKEIYEGDILRFYALNPKKGTKKLKLQHRDTVIEWRADRARWGQKLLMPVDGESPWVGCFYDRTLSDRHEIIGNIYENPELLK